MKLRIKGNSLRIRLTKTEVSTLAETGYLQEQTHFGNVTLTYALQAKEDAGTLSATMNNNTITMYVPAAFTKEWAKNDVVGLSGNMAVDNKNSLSLLLEKDFVCLDETTEDQSDNYHNPNSAC
jgi:hypothetical protein